VWLSARFNSAGAARAARAARDLVAHEHDDHPLGVVRAAQLEDI
jgi:hypothetical protein